MTCHPFVEKFCGGLAQAGRVTCNKEHFCHFFGFSFSTDRNLSRKLRVTIALIV